MSLVSSPLEIEKCSVGFEPLLTVHLKCFPNQYQIYSCSIIVTDGQQLLRGEKVAWGVDLQTPIPYIFFDKVT